MAPEDLRFAEDRESNDLSFWETMDMEINYVETDDRATNDKETNNEENDDEEIQWSSRTFSKAWKARIELWRKVFLWIRCKRRRARGLGKVTILGRACESYCS